jgi:phosphonate transport system substrate-binding protein
VGLLHKALERAETLSGGERQRVGVARALAQGPRLILADEPVASLDPASARMVLGMLHRICKEDGLAAVVSLHQVDLARAYADRVVGLNQGRVVFDGPPRRAGLRGAGFRLLFAQRPGPPPRFGPDPGNRDMTRALPLVALLTLALTGCSGSGPGSGGESDPDPLKAALLPDESPNTVITNNRKLKEYLEQQLGRKVELVVTTDYSSMIEAVRHGRVHLAYFGPLSYVLARQKTEIEPFAALKSQGSTTYRAVLIANAAAGIDSVAAVRGKDVAFGDAASTSSHLIPKAMLAQKGLKAGADYRAHFVGAHDAVALTVQNGKAQAGGLSKPIFESLLGRGVIDPNKVKVLQESKPFPQYPWAMRSELKPELKERIRAAFLSLRDQEVLRPFKAEGFGPVADPDYDVVRDLGKLLNLDLARASGK